MTIVDDKIAFAEKHIKNKEGVRWKLKGREWIRDEFWRPADGWKLWRFDDSDPCDDCASHIGEIIDHPADNVTAKCKRCPGLAAEPILVTVVELERGDGKTFNLCGYSMATLFTQRNKSMSAIWASEDQGTKIFDENWNAAIRQSETLAHPKWSRVHGSPPVLDVIPTHSLLEVLSVSHRSVTGGRRTHILIDEARDVPARTMTALLPSTNAMHGVECPYGHVQLTPEDIEESGGEYPSKCSACGKRLAEWWPRIIIVSAAGVLGNNPERDWFHELVETLAATPHKNYHLFRSGSYGKRLNPRKSEKVSSAITDVFGAMTSTRHYVAAEYGNQWTQQGEDVMTPADVKRVMDRALHNEEGNNRRTMGFLDTSLTTEKTSLVLLSEDDTASSSPWEFVYLSYLEFWWPGHGEYRQWRRIKPEVIEQTVETVAPLFSRLTLHIDVKTGPRRRDAEEAWPVEMFRRLKKGPEEWRRRLKKWTGSEEDGDIGWDLMKARVLDGTMALQYSKEILEEIKGVMVLTPKQSDGRPKVVDRNRRVMHKDITQGLACLCYLIKRDQLRGARGAVTKEQVAKRLVTNALRGGTGTRRAGRLKLGPDGW